MKKKFGVIKYIAHSFVGNSKNVSPWKSTVTLGLQSRGNSTFFRLTLLLLPTKLCASYIIYDLLLSNILLETMVIQNPQKQVDKYSKSLYFQALQPGLV
jgi:hypothetical protein